MSKVVGTGPSSYKKRIYRAAVSQRLRNTGLGHEEDTRHCLTESYLHQQTASRLTSIRNVHPSILSSLRLEFLARDWQTSWVGPSSRMSRCEPRSSSWIDVLSANPSITGSTSPRRVPPSNRSASRHSERLTVSPASHALLCPCPTSIHVHHESAYLEYLSKTVVSVLKIPEFLCQ